MIRQSNCEQIPSKLILKQSHRQLFRKTLLDSKFQWLNKYLSPSQNIFQDRLNSVITIKKSNTGGTRLTPQPAPTNFQSLPCKLPGPQRSHLTLTSHPKLPCRPKLTSNPKLPCRPKLPSHQKFHPTACSHPTRLKTEANEAPKRQRRINSCKPQRQYWKKGGPVMEDVSLSPWINGEEECMFF